EFRASIVSVSVYSVVGFITYFAVQAGFIEVYGDAGKRGWGYFWAVTLLMIVVQDTYFYWMHRLLHMPALMKYSHYYHHKSINPSPWTSYSFDTIEAAGHALFVPLYLLFVPMPGFGVFIFMGHMMVRNAIAHSGYEIYPRWWAKNPVMGWINLVTHHDMHHSNGQTNFGLWFTWWDRWMGTEHPEYLARASGDPIARRGGAFGPKAALQIHQR
ncbi:MAG: sterol desaturase family protein, partial [Kordiimonadaceae bacterium]|nr:sterol desaturase family protein [Kordiimonadaceae bacterium]